MLIRILIASNLWVGLAVFALCMLSFPEPFSAVSIFYSAFMWFGTASAYSYMRWVKLVQGEALPKRPKIGWDNNWVIALISTFSAGIIAISFLKQIFSNSLLYALAPGLVIALLYPLAFPHPNRHFSSLRSIPMLKLLLIAYAWSWLSFGVPHLLSEGLWTSRTYLELVMRMLLVAGLTIPFDVRDLHIDAPSLKTLPQQLGLVPALDLARFLIMLYQIWIVLSFFFWSLNLNYVLAWVLGLELGQWIIKRVEKDQSDFYISFWVESIPILVLFILFLSQLAIGNFYI